MFIGINIGFDLKSITKYTSIHDYINWGPQNQGCTLILIPVTQTSFDFIFECVIWSCLFLFLIYAII